MPDDTPQRMHAFHVNWDGQHCCAQCGINLVAYQQMAPRPKCEEGQAQGMPGGPDPDVNTFQPSLSAPVYLKVFVPPCACAPLRVVLDKENDNPLSCASCGYIWPKQFLKVRVEGAPQEAIRQ